MAAGSWANRVREALFPAECALCRAPGAWICPRCSDSLSPAPPGPAPPGVERVVAAYLHTGAARAIVAEVKYRGRYGAVAALADAVALTAAAQSLPRPDVLTWAPTTDVRRRARGYDHAARLARVLGRRFGVAATPRLRRAPGPPQTGRTRAARLEGPQFTTVSPVAPDSVVFLVDDVMTTGATFSAAARSLDPDRRAHVIALCATRVPAPGPALGPGTGKPAGRSVRPRSEGPPLRVTFASECHAECRQRSADPDHGDANGVVPPSGGAGCDRTAGE